MFRVCVNVIRSCTWAVWVDSECTLVPSVLVPSPSISSFHYLITHILNLFSTFHCCFFHDDQRVPVFLFAWMLWISRFLFMLQLVPGTQCKVQWYYILTGSHPGHARVARRVTQVRILLLRGSLKIREFNVNSFTGGIIDVGDVTRRLAWKNSRKAVAFHHTVLP